MSIASLLLVVSCVAIGYLAQVTGLCLVRGVRDWQRGRRMRLLAILSSGFWIYLYLPFVAAVSGARPLLVYAPHWSFVVGGLLFGIGAAFNRACAVSTATRLASGDLAMLATMTGWPTGWLLIDRLGICPAYAAEAFEPGWPSAVLVVLSALGATAIYWRARHHWPLWSGISLVGVLSGAVFLLQPAWSPSDFVRDIGQAIAHADPARLPSVDRIAALASMLLGMAAGAWRHGRFTVRGPTRETLLRHFPAGVLMGAGTALALGGNDFQILLGLPALSVAALSAVAGMLTGLAVTLKWITQPEVKRT